VIAALIDLAKEMRAAKERGETLGLTGDELAFYDALEVQEDAVQALVMITFASSLANY